MCTKHEYEYEYEPVLDPGAILVGEPQPYGWRRSVTQSLRT